MKYLLFTLILCSCVSGPGYDYRKEITWVQKCIGDPRGDNPFSGKKSTSFCELIPVKSNYKK